MIRTTDLDPWGYEYEPIRRNVTGTDTKWKFLGKEQDSESGYYDLEARKYQPTLGLFLGAEPLYGEWFGISPFSYALNNPLLYEDQSGLSPTERKWNSETGRYEYWAEEEVVYSNNPALSLPSLWAIEFMAHKSGNYKRDITSNPYWQEQASGRLEESWGLEMFVGGVGSKLAMSVIGGLGKELGKRVIQTGGHTLSRKAVKELNLTKEQAKSAMEALKADNLLPPNFHSTKIWSNGDVTNSHTNQLIGNIFDYLP